MSDNLIRCVHENGKVCFLTKAATENRNFMKKYGIRVEHVAKEPARKTETLEVKIDLAPVQELIDKTIQELKGETLERQDGPDLGISLGGVSPVEGSVDLPSNPEAEAEAVDKQVAEALAEATKPAKPKAARKPRTPKKPTKK